MKQEVINLRTDEGRPTFISNSIAEMEDYYKKKYFSNLKGNYGFTIIDNSIICNCCNKKVTIEKEKSSNIIDDILKKKTMLCCQDNRPSFRFSSLGEDIFFLQYIIDFIDSESFYIVKALKVIRLEDHKADVDMDFKITSYAHYKIGDTPTTFVERKNGNFTKSKAESGISYANAMFYKGSEITKRFEYRMHRPNIILGMNDFEISKFYLEYIGMYNFIKTNNNYNVSSLLKYIHKASHFTDNTLEILSKAGFDTLVRSAITKSGANTISKREGSKLKDKIRLRKPLLPFAKMLSEGEILLLEEIEKSSPGIELDSIFEILRRLYRIDSDAYSCTNQQERLNMFSDRHTSRYLREILSILKYNIRPKKIIEYMDNYYYQQAIPYSTGIIIWKDYLTMSEEIKESHLKNSGVKYKYDKYPSSLKLKHDLALRSYLMMETEDLDKEIEEKAERNKDLEIENSKYKIVFPKSSKELIAEGDILNHCVGSYAKNIANNKTNVVFLRDKKKINKPLFTIEYGNGRILQLEGFNRCKPNDEDIINLIESFENKIMRETAV